MLRKGLVLVLLVFSQLPGRCGSFDFNANCKQAYDTILALKLTKGQQLVDAEKREHPNNAATLLLDDYIDFLRIYLSGSKQVRDNLSKHSNDRLSSLRNANRNSPWYLYAQAEVLLHQAFASVKFHEFGSAFWNIRKAYKLLEQNAAEYPDFAPNKKSMGMLKAMLGIIPSKYQWGLSLLGMEGSLSKGMEQLKVAANTDFEFHKEAVVIYAMLLLHLESKPQDAWAVIKANNLPFANDLFSTFVAGNIALYSRHNSEALTILNNRPRGAAYEPFPYLDYLTGLAHLQQLDTVADSYFNNFIAQNKGNDFIKSAYHKLAWSALVHHRPADYNRYMQKVRVVGATEADADKQAQKEAEQGQVPDTSLLKARLLFDGGNYDRALKALAEKPENSYTAPQQQLELVYRKGRIYDEMGKDTLAEMCYRMTIFKGKNQPYFYAANAALQLAYIYERQGDKANARNYFNQCLQMKGGEYENSLAAKAQAGLDRLR